MKMIIFLITSGLLFFSVVATSAQTPNFSGKWKLHTESPHLKPDFMTMNVSQSPTELKVETTIKLQKSEEIITKNYNLEGKQTFIEAHDGLAAAELNANSQPDGNLRLTSTVFMTNKAEKFTVERESVWELINGGKTLKVTEYMKSIAGKAKNAEGIEMYFTKE